MTRLRRVWAQHGNLLVPALLHGQQRGSWDGAKPTDVDGFVVTWAAPISAQVASRSWTTFTMQGPNNSTWYLEAGASLEPRVWPRATTDPEWVLPLEREVWCVSTTDKPATWKVELRVRRHDDALEVHVRNTVGLDDDSACFSSIKEANAHLMQRGHRLA